MHILILQWFLQEILLMTCHYLIAPLLPCILALHCVQINYKEATIMATNKFLPLEQFTFLVDPPDSHISSLRVNIYADGRLNLSGRLAAALNGKPVQIRFTGDAKHLCCIESDSENAIRFPKNGSKRLPSALEHLKGHKIPLPARYEVSYNEERAFWQGDHSENPPATLAKNQTGLKRK